MPANLRIHIPVTPGTGTFKGGHIYIEAPDQSATPAARMDGTTLMDGTATMQGSWAPIDMGRLPYVAGEQPWTLEVYTGIDTQVAQNIRVYVASYSDDMDMPLVRYGMTGATPSFVVTVPAQVSGKPNSGSNITPFLVTGISGAVSAAVSVGGKLKRPIGITVDLSGLSAHRPALWAYQLIGFVNGDLTTTPILVSGYMTDDGLIPAGPDGISIPHTFGPEEPTAITSITVYAVAGLLAGSRMPSPRGTLKISSEFQPNNIVPGITASCVISIGTVTGVVDPTAFVNALLNSAEFHIDPATGKFAMHAVDFSKAMAGTFTTEFAGGSGSPLSIGALIADKLKTGVLEVGGADSGGNRVSRFKVFDNTTPTANLIGWIGDDSAGSGYVGAWFKRILIGGVSPATAKIVADAAGNVSIDGSLLVGGVGGALIVGSLSNASIPGSGVSGDITKGGTLATKFVVQDGANAQIMWAGKFGADYGLWAKNAWFGGSGPSSAKIWLDALGNAHFSGSIDAGTTISAGISLTSPVITGGSLTITSGTIGLTVNTSDWVKLLDSSNGKYVQLRTDLISIYASGHSLGITQGAVSWDLGSGYSSAYTASNVTFYNNQVLGTRQTGPGNPSFGTLANAQTWCQNLLTALQTHGLVT